MFFYTETKTEHVVSHVIFMHMQKDETVCEPVLSIASRKLLNTLVAG